MAEKRRRGATKLQPAEKKHKASELKPVDVAAVAHSITLMGLPPKQQKAMLQQAMELQSQYLETVKEMQAAEFEREESIRDNEAEMRRDQLNREENRRASEEWHRLCGRSIFTDLIPLVQAFSSQSAESAVAKVKPGPKEAVSANDI